MRFGLGFSFALCFICSDYWPQWISAGIPHLLGAPQDRGQGALQGDWLQLYHLHCCSEIFICFCLVGCEVHYSVSVGSSHSAVCHKPLLQLASTCIVVLWCRSYRERHEDVENPGNNLYVTGLSIRVTEKDLEKYFAKVGEVRLQVKLDKLDWSQWCKSKCPTMLFVRIFWWLPGLPTVQGALSVYQVEFGLIPGFLNLQVIEARLVVDPRTRESRGFGFVTMSRVKDADRCIRHLHGSTLEGRIITVEKVRTAWLQTNGNFWWQHGIYSHEKLQLGCKQREYTGVALSLGVLVAWPCSCVLCQAWFSFAISLWGITGLGLDNPCSVWCVVFSKGLTTYEGGRNAEETYRVSHQVSKVCYFSWQIVTSQLDFEISNSRRSSPQAKAQVNPT